MPLLKSSWLLNIPTFTYRPCSALEHAPNLSAGKVPEALINRQGTKFGYLLMSSIQNAFFVLPSVTPTVGSLSRWVLSIPPSMLAVIWMVIDSFLVYLPEGIIGTSRSFLSLLPVPKYTLVSLMLATVEMNVAWFYA